MRSPLLTIALTSVALAGCGGAAAVPEHVRAPDPTPAASGPPTERARAPKVSSKNRAEKPIGRSESEKTQSGSGGSNPCTLVSRSEAKTIVGHHVATVLAPLGPTCVYGAGKRSVTLAVQDVALASATKGSRSVIKLKVSGRQAYCVDRGGLKLLVPLSAGKALSVGAACPIAAQFAAKALARLSA
jgi:hypothetical protein